MYFWKIDKLNEQLISDGLSESEQFKYLMANSILYALAVIQYETPNDYDTLAGVVGVFVTIFGLWLIYKCNGGINGKQIIQRYLSVGFIVFIRVFVLFMLPAVIASLVIQEMYLGGIPEETTMSLFIVILASQVVLIFLSAKHINYIAKRTNA
ncbi:MAG: hypothetical protein OEY06_13645 [Gammaproteobacteria bacterium]|nr:hypothetical protein [Gammaproteobacteria bacterium]